MRRWTLRTLTYAAIIIAWDPANDLQSRFLAARTRLDAMYESRRRVGRTYQGFIKALIRWSPMLLRRIETQLRAATRRTAGACWETFGWVILGVDGSKLATPRTAALEKAFGCSGRGRGGPQISLTMILHLATGLPWCWKIGKANVDERAHLRAMTRLLPTNTLLVADAGFVGYDLWSTLMQADHAILFRVGSNVKLLRKLGYAAKERDGLVYLWPTKHRQRSCPPLVLRLIRLHDGRKQVCLITNVLDTKRLSDAQAADVYRMRWKLEIGFREMKQTMQCRKLRSGAPVQAALELRWSVVGLSLLRLMGVRAIMQRGGEAKNLSFAAALREVRTTLQAIHPISRSPRRAAALAPRRVRRADGLMHRLSRAIKDTYKRKAPKTARNWPHKKTDHPPKPPKIRNATPTEIQAAKQLTN